MFFIFGIAPRTKAIGNRTPVEVHDCGSFGGYQLYEQKTSFSLFFIPIFSWNRKYMAESSCCHRWYEVEEDTAKDYIHGRISNIPKDKLKPMMEYPEEKICPKCGHYMDIDDAYCSKCGTKVD